MTVCPGSRTGWGGIRLIVDELSQTQNKRMAVRTNRARLPKVSTTGQIACGLWSRDQTARGGELTGCR